MQKLLLDCVLLTSGDGTVGWKPKGAGRERPDAWWLGRAVQAYVRRPEHLR